MDPAQLRRMSDTLLHRGPDEEGQFVRPGVGLAARRLSIIDVAEGHQPVTNEDGSVTVVFNGEIYNYLSLREELLRKGHRLLTRSDTEVIPHLYEEEGPACVERLDGMFAFALYDSRPQSSEGPAARPPGRLLLARDRMGKKPLYYADVEGALIFGSELKPILLDPRVSKELDLEALHHYLSLQVVPAPYSIFQKIRKLPPGCILECDARGLAVRPYWKYLDFVGDRHVPEEEAVVEIRRMLFQAVEKRLMSDVPLGAFLSGGLDSSTVVAIMSRLNKEPVKTFSIGFEAPELYNELPDARLLAQHCHTEHHEVVLQPSSVQTIEEMVQYADEPFAISSAIPLLVISRWARQHVTVVLTGDGGDEAFAGYDHYIFERWLAAYRRFPAALDKLLAGSAKTLGGSADAASRRLLRRTIRSVEQARRSP
ncbi:MAG: asparagine synthase (glutamine-hydrolyzing), partial [Terriglobales bacterium]